jgi:hypothetical protein
MFTLTQWAIIGFVLAWLVAALMEYFEPGASADLSGSERGVTCVAIGLMWAFAAALVVAVFASLGLLWISQ